LPLLKFQPSQKHSSSMSRK